MILASALLTCAHEFMNMYRTDSLKDNRVYIVVVMGVMEILKTFGAYESFPAQRLFRQNQSSSPLLMQRQTNTGSRQLLHASRVLSFSLIVLLPHMHFEYDVGLPTEIGF
jgi:hypothetical protein